MAGVNQSATETDLTSARIPGRRSAARSHRACWTLPANRCRPPRCCCWMAQRRANSGTAGDLTTQSEAIRTQVSSRGFDPGSVQLQRVAVEVFGALDLDQHRKALLVGRSPGPSPAAPACATLPHTPWARLHHAGRCHRTARCRPSATRHRRATAALPGSRPSPWCRRCRSSRWSSPCRAFPQRQVLIVEHHRAAARRDLCIAGRLHRADQADVLGECRVDVRLQGLWNGCHGLRLLGWIVAVSTIIARARQAYATLGTNGRLVKCSAPLANRNPAAFTALSGTLSSGT